jgi:hypothetical protein
MTIGTPPLFIGSRVRGPRSTIVEAALRLDPSPRPWTGSKDAH